MGRPQRKGFGQFGILGRPLTRSESARLRHQKARDIKQAIQTLERAAATSESYGDMPFVETLRSAIARLEKLRAPPTRRGVITVAPLPTEIWRVLALVGFGHISSK